MLPQKKTKSRQNTIQQKIVFETRNRAVPSGVLHVKMSVTSVIKKRKKRQKL